MRPAVLTQSLIRGILLSVSPLAEFVDCLDFIPTLTTSALKTNGMQTLFSSVAGIDYQKFSCAVAKESFTSSRSKSVLFNSTSGILQLETKQIAMDKRNTPYDS